MLAVIATQTSNITIALIALVGAVVGATVTGGAQLLAERMQHKREREEAEIRARGVARVVSYYLAIWEPLLAQAQQQKSWWNARLEPVPGWVGPDLQVIAARCAKQRWAQIQAALVVAQTAATMRETAGNDPDLAFDKAVFDDQNNRAIHEQMRHALEGGITALDQEFG